MSNLPGIGPKFIPIFQVLDKGMHFATTMMKWAHYVTENMPPAFSRASSLTARVAMTPIPFSQQLLEQDSEIPLPEEPAELKRPLKKTKRVRLLLDPRTELTDEELKVGILLPSFSTRV